jgi:hypothetical protein
VGRVYPESIGLSLGEPILSTFNVDGKTIRAHMHVNNSVVSLTLLDEVTEEEFPTVKNAAQAQIRKFANVATLNSSMFNVVILEEFIDAETGAVRRISHREPLDEDDEPKQYKLNTPSFATLDNPAVAHALEAYNNAIREHDFTAKFALEAIEAVRSYWGGPEKWSEMRSNLNLKEDTLKRHNSAATSQKHGQNLLQDWSDRKDQLLVAREAIRRLIAFLDGGKSALPEESFPTF